mmetsp:Transcript_39173/g.121449  ORF Transcript_39173/g.121449 Transcript_39173/m.121449 type:complete len:395 (+) Transcript_39173:367-1551(+)
MRASCKGLKHLVRGSERFWSLLDGGTVAAGFLELLLPMSAPLIWGSEGGKEAASESLTLRMLRLLRLLRLLRFLHLVKRLDALLKSLRYMADAIVSIFGVLFVFIISCAIMCTQLIGHVENHAGGEGPQPEDYFKDVTTSMFTLFQITTLDNWMDIAAPLIARDWRWQIFFIFFICFASWTMISILTAVASESVVEAAYDREEAEVREREELQESFLQFLRQSFVEADVDGNGVIDKEEFDALIQKESMLNRMSQEGVGVTVDDLQKAWETLDNTSGRCGELTIDEFVTGFLTLSKGISTQDIAHVDYTLRKVGGSAAVRIQRLHKLVQNVKASNDQVIEALVKQRALQAEQLACMGIWRQWALERDPKAIPQHSQQLLQLPRGGAGLSRRRAS